MSAPQDPRGPTPSLGSSPPAASESEAEHTLKNHLAIIIGYCDLLLAETPVTDTRHGDLLEIHRAAKEALRLVDREREG